jgi:hypothetical protein
MTAISPLGAMPLGVFGDYAVGTSVAVFVHHLKTQGLV